ncbi:hypothetical protein K469DRAFT_652879 [Zopfia rhizophila CBS 207.26]|uniref:Spindle pole body component n=1 Tax=Zopfia rhizophila CBS 207.26 TaxID=1314779 RepID=A0A6A6ET53_9PEZI|nr:hypothetical protein K469DRAFT_652879 [Zopfia rhizophila CBS 207.26]
MDDDDFIHNVFTTDHLWKPSSFFEDSSAYESSLFAPLQLDVPSTKLDNPYAPKQTLDRELQLPDLETFEFGSLPELESLDQSSFSVDTEPPDPEDEVWQIALELGPANKDAVFFTWEAFEDPDQFERHSPYISESGAKAFDEALHVQSKKDGKTDTGRVLKENILLDSLLNLGLGRSSILFSFDPKLRTFIPAIPNGRPSGLSVPSAQSLTKHFILTGNTFLYLRSFVERTFASASSIPARVVLATSVSAIISTFEDYLGQHARNVKSLLQLERLFTKPQEILFHVTRVVDAVKVAKTNELFSSILHQRVLEVEEGDEYLRQLSILMLRRVSQPSIELVSEWIGIQQERETVPFQERNSFVVIEDNPDNQGPPEYTYNADMMPQFISTEHGKMIFETGNSLRFLKTHHPHHPLVCSEKFGIQPPELEWEFTWHDIEIISEKARVYEDHLRTAIREFGGNSHQQHQICDSSPAVADSADVPSVEFEKYIEESGQLFDQFPKQILDSIPDELQLFTEQILSVESNSELNERTTFSPPLSLTSVLSFGPLLTAQAKLVNSTVLRLFFGSHQLRMHLSLQRQYHLLGDSVFSSHLASVLFDPELETAERRKGTMRSGVHMGLQLGSRSTWPPASSELRLALMGVLSESYYSSALYHSTITKGHAPDQVSEFSRSKKRDRDELPGQLNFAVRQLSEAEMEKVMDPNSLYALDFLRLQYVPPTPLNLVITSTALEKYDYIFKFLLRLLRMLFVVSHLPREYSDIDSKHFRMEAHHFITTISSYIFQTGIGEHWDAFESFIDTIETRLKQEDADGELGTRVKEGLESLKASHEQCLDSIMFSLLLRRRQKKVMALLEEIFDHILLFAKMQNEDMKLEENIKDLYAKLKGKIKVFISVCRGLTGKKGYGKGKGTGEENTTERLLVLLEMNGYYAG